MAAPKAILGGIYYLSGVLVKAETKEVAKKLIAKGFRTATEGIKNSGLKVQTVTNSNFATYVTRALKKAMEQSQKIRQAPKLDPKTGRPVGQSSAKNKLGGSGQSAIGRKLGSMRMANYGRVRGGKPRAESMAKAKPPNVKIKSKDKVPKSSATIAGLVAAAAIGKVAYNAYIKNNSPTVTQIKAAEKQIETAKINLESFDNVNDQPKAAQDLVDNRYTGSGVPPLTAEQERKLNKELAVINLQNKKSSGPETKKEPVRPRLRPKVVEAKPMSLGSYLNAEIKSRKSTATKEKAKAKKGNYKSIAEAKKAKSLYYIKDGKPMAAVYKKDLKGL